MTALLEFQRTMARAVMRPLTQQDNMRRATNRRDGNGSEDAVAMVKPNSRLSSFERLEIYNRCYWSRVQDAFSEDFPGVRAVVGAKRFELMRRAYLNDCPSQSFTMRNLGEHLAKWMERNAALVGPRHEIALEMARLEWAEIESFDAAEHERLSPEEIAALEPTSTLHLQPHLRWMKAAYEIDKLLLEIRESLKRTTGEAAGAVTGGAVTGGVVTSNATPAASYAKRVVRGISEKRIARARSAESLSPIYLAIHRYEMVVHYKRLDAEMFRLLQALAQGLPIADAIESAYAESEFTPEQCQHHVQQSFALFGALGWFCNTRSTNLSMREGTESYAKEA